MYAVPADLDLGRLLGQDLSQICISKFCMQLNFDKDDIECEGTVMADVGGATMVIFDTHPGLLVGATPEDAMAWRDASLLPRLVGQTVTDWRVEGSHEFSITLSNGTKLRFQSQDRPFEDFVIFGGEWVI